MANFKTLDGKASPLGSTYDGKGVNFALFSAHATKVELCVFDASGSEELERYPITTNDNSIWHIYLEGAKPDLVYGYRVYGPYKPEEGLRFTMRTMIPYATVTMVMNNGSEKPPVYTFYSTAQKYNKTEAEG